MTQMKQIKVSDLQERTNLMKIKWNKGQPPKDGRRYLLKFSSGIVCSGRYRLGNLHEPQQSELDWRCDCCGRFATPIGWIEHED